MSKSIDALILDLLEWLGEHERPYKEVMDAWRTSCPRLQVWEEANERGLIDQRDSSSGPVVSASSRGRAFLRAAQRDPR